MRVLALSLLLALTGGGLLLTSIASGSAMPGVSSADCGDAGVWCVYAGGLAGGRASTALPTTTATATVTRTPSATPTATMTTASSTPTATTGQASPTPTRTPTTGPSGYFFVEMRFCSTEPGCPNGPSALSTGSPIYAVFYLNETPDEPVRAEGHRAGVGLYAPMSWAGLMPYAGPGFSTGSVLGTGVAPGTVELRVWVGDQYVGSFQANVTGNPVSTATPTRTPTRTATATRTPTRTPTTTGGGALTIWDIDGWAYLISDDDTYLGAVSSNRFATDSICNRFGTYGSQYSSLSVRNPYGTYGSPYSLDSAYNPYTISPPAIIYLGSVVGYLTKNPYLYGGVDPDYLFAAYGCT